MNFNFEKGSITNLELEFPKAILGWYALPKKGRALFISGGAPEGEVLPEVFTDSEITLDVCKLEEMDKTDFKNSSYDIVAGFGIIERAAEPGKLLKKLYECLTDDGHMLVAADNRIGIRYFCGDKDAFTGQVFDGIDNYKVYSMGPGGEKKRAYAKAEYEEMLEKAGFINKRFYTALPNIENPRLLFAEDVFPNEKLEHRIYPEYRNPSTVFLEEERLYDTLIQNGLFHPMGNGYLIECTKSGSLANVQSVTSSLDRGPVYSMYTVIRRDGKVEKRPAYPEGSARLNELIENNKYLNEHGIKTITGSVIDGAFVMPFVEAEDTTEYFRKLFWQDRNLFEKELDRWMELIENSSEHVPYDKVDWGDFEPWIKNRKADDPYRDKWRKLAYGTDEEKKNIGSILRRGFIDLACINCLVDKGKFLFFDQEFAIDNLPANAIKIRTIDFIYDSEMERAFSKTYYYEKYQLKEHAETWKKYSKEFIDRLRNRDAMLPYLLKVTRNGQMAASNRNRINFPGEEYDRVLHDIFANIDGKKIFVFGSGNFAKVFLDRYSEHLDIAGILDNNSGKWGAEMRGIPISGMDLLLKENPENTKVYICIKFYQEVMRDLKKAGFEDVCVFNPDEVYPNAPGRQVRVPGMISNETSSDITGKSEPKKYKVGYISGVFDLFHIGHVNLFRRAKEQCEYLIVGVVTDEQAMNGKRTSPHIPFEQRIEIVRACRYVDEAVRIPPEAADTQEAYMRYHFDAQFSGSDYEEAPYWISCRDWLRSKGSDFIFLPYTKETSTTEIKKNLQEDH